MLHRVCVIVLGVLGMTIWLTADEAPVPDQRAAAKKLYDDGNFRDAGEIYRRLVLTGEASGDPLVGDFRMAIQCYRQLQQPHEVDGFLEQAVEIRAADWRLLSAAAESMIGIEHYGFITAGEFHRGNLRGGGQYVDASERDRVRALQLCEQARPLAVRDADKQAVATFFAKYAQAWNFGREAGNAWRLQDLTDLSVLPDYEEGQQWNWGWRGGSVGKGAPVDAQGHPVLYAVPAAFDTAASDGERWRWCLSMVVENQPSRRAEMDWQFAEFLHGQFGVQTMRQWGIVLPQVGEGTGDDVDESGPYALHSLGEDETIAKLATGVKRFALPDEFNPIRIWQRLAEGDDQGYAELALDRLAQVFEDRQQYPRAAEYWRLAIRKFGAGNDAYREQRLAQIVGGWGRFEAVQSQSAGRPATLEYRFRNGKKISFEAHRVRIDRLLDDVKAYLKSNPNQVDWERLQIENIGQRLVNQNESRYRGPRVAQWETALEPRADHFDRRVTITTPLREAGAYLLIGRLADGNVSRSIIWLDDVAIAKKNVGGRAWYFVANADSGAAIADANVEFLGWKQEQTSEKRPVYRLVTSNFAEKTDKQGQVSPNAKLLDRGMQWIVIARPKQGGLAYLGFSGLWNLGDYYDAEYEQTKVYLITDRPVYRPDQKVQFKFWIRKTKFDQPEASDFANQSFTVQIHDPQGTEVFQQEYTTDAYGGLSGEYALPAGAALGVYSASIRGLSGGNFRVEEFKKPEYDVTVETPRKPMRLGETVTATIKARYYFGAPVTQASVKYKVERTPKDARWFPIRRWDWLYGNGYWWFASDYAWYPGFGRWGCFAPIEAWWGWNPDPPELVLDQEVPIGADGTVQVEIDTALAKELHGDQDHEYKISVEVVDQSRRTILGGGSVLVAREPFKVFAWTDRGHYRVGDTVGASFQARTLDGKGVPGTGALRLLKISYDDAGQPVEAVAQEWKLDTDDEGRAEQQIKASEPGQYRLSYAVRAEGQEPRDGDGTGAGADSPTIEGGYVFVVQGEGFDGSEFRFNDIELITDKAEYAPGEKVNVLINTNRVGSTVLLFVRPSNGVYLPPEVLHLDGKSMTHEVMVVAKDMPNFFLEAVTIARGKVHTAVREVIVPPEERVLDVAIEPSAEKYKPGEEATVQVKLTEANGEPFSGSIALSMYDRAVDYIAGGSNVPEIREFFWKWVRSHTPQTEHSLERWFYNLLKDREIPMSDLGAFGDLAADLESDRSGRKDDRVGGGGFGGGFGGGVPARPMMLRGAAAPESSAAFADEAVTLNFSDMSANKEGEALVEPTIRSEFADTAFWKGDITTDASGTAEVTLNMPENLTGWKVRAWGMGHGTRVGEGTSEVVTFKNLLIRLQSPRFFVEKDEVVLSAIVHNYLETEKTTTVELVLEGGTLEVAEGQEGQGLGRLTSAAPEAVVPANGSQRVTIPAGGEVRVDWRVKVVREGEAVITMKALTDEESDAMLQTFPVYVHGMLKTESYSGVIRPGAESGEITIHVPAERRVEQTRLEIRYSPTLAGAMVDALPYLVDYPYGCTEQTLNRFLPTVITQNILQRMNLDLAAIREKRTNLNAQEIGDDAARGADWGRLTRHSHGKDWNPVFDDAEVGRMVKQGVKDLTAMQLSDGGWGWFSGYGERSYPHTTAVVVHGLQVAQRNNVALVPGMLERGVEWLKRYQDEQIALLKKGDEEQPVAPYRTQAGDLDALVFLVLVDAGQHDAAMQDYLYRDRNKVSLYSQSLLGLALHAVGAVERRDMVIRNVDQFVKVDEENQTAYLDLPNHGGYWWYWYGDVIEANANYLKLLTKVNPQDPKASGIVKYLLNNRRHATYWNSTRDTAVCIEALADYLVASGEAQPRMLVEVWIDGELQQSVEITPEVLFTFDNSLVVEGEALSAGAHKIELRRRALGQGPRGEGQGARGDDANGLGSERSAPSPLYYNAYFTNFTLEDFITKGGLEIKVDRKFYKLVQREGAEDAVQGARGQVVDQRALKYDRVLLENLAEVHSGDLVEVELEIDSKNDYEYVIFEDLKAAGFETVDVRSGYTAGGLGAYVEFRDERAAFFLRTLARGKHSVSYRLYAEIPGQFSALPTRAYAMYAPELKANSDEMKVRVEDREEAVGAR